MKGNQFFSTSYDYYLDSHARISQGLQTNYVLEKYREDFLTFAKAFFAKWEAESSIPSGLCALHSCSWSMAGSALQSVEN